jgi:hypothetical protein
MKQTAVILTIILGLPGAIATWEQCGVRASHDHVDPEFIDFRALVSRVARSVQGVGVIICLLGLSSLSFLDSTCVWANDCKCPPL